MSEFDLKKRKKAKLPDTTDPTPGFDLGGSKQNSNNISEFRKKIELHVLRPLQSSTINTASYWTFQYKLRKNQWGRLKSNALTVVLWGRRDNPTRNQEAGATAEQRANYHSLLAKNGEPEIFFCPTVQATGLVKHVDVYLNNVLVPTSGGLQGHLLHYVRMNKIFSARADPRYFATTNDISFALLGDKMTPTMKLATQAFHYETWHNTEGVRVPIYLDGYFPFSFKNQTLQSIDGHSPENLYFPPETLIEIRVHLYRDKIESLFHDGIDNIKVGYFEDGDANRPANNLYLSFQDACLELETAELDPAEHLQAMSRFEQGAFATYEYDIPRCQHQALLANLSYTTNIFHIQPAARLAYILFLPSWACFPMENKRKPMSGFSRFPENCTNLKISYGSDPTLITETFENFGIRGESNQISKKIYFDYLKERLIFPGDFSDLFPKEIDVSSLIQVFVIDLKHQFSSKVETLTINCHFGRNRTSPSNQQILVISVHTDGLATCHFAGKDSEFIWKFNHTG